MKKNATLLKKETTHTEYTLSIENDSMTVYRVKITRSKPYDIIISKSENTTKYDLREVSKEELFELRASKKPGVVIKQMDHLYYTEVPFRFNLRNMRITHGNHLCGCCSRCSASREPGKGCLMIMERPIESYTLSNVSRIYLRNLKDSSRIEKYPFIMLGIESFNVHLNSCVIINCSTYTNSKRSDKKDDNDDIESSKSTSTFWDTVSF